MEGRNYKINGRAIKELLDKKRKKRGPRTVYLAQSLFDDFKKAVAPDSPSAVLEILMEGFIDTLGKRK